jgi:N-acetylglucosamine-6-sulfatase
MIWRSHVRKLLPLLVLGAGCTASSDAQMLAGDAGPPAGPAKPNIIMVLTDDLSWNLVRYMPHVKLMQQRGMTFSHYYVTDSLCCPSRSSIFTGKFPHDTQVFTNSGNDGGYAQFERVGNAGQTFATTLAAAGYRAGMMGKYLNGYDPTMNQADPGWSEWDVAGNGYPEFNYALNQNGMVTNHGDTPDDYLTDVLAGLGMRFVMHGGAPFILEVATFAPHAPYTPAPRNVGEFAKNVPRTPAFNALNVNPPQWLEEHGVLTQTMVDNLDAAFNLRVEAVQAVDDLIATLTTTLTVLGLDQNTYIVFTSDNGYHMGDHTLPAGKMTAFDTDINVPLIVVGPGVPAGVTVDNIVENIDLCPTFAEIAGTAPPAMADGRSLLPLLHGQTVSGWRDAALIEHHGPDLAPMDPDDPDNEPPGGPPPNSYEAIRMASSVYVEYQNGDLEYYDLTSDPFEMTNTAGSLPADQLQKLHRTLNALQNCHGAADCWQAAKL